MWGSALTSFSSSSHLFCSLNIVVSFLLVLINQIVLNGGNFAPRPGTFGNVRRHLGGHDWVWGYWNPSGVQLNALQCTGQLPHDRASPSRCVTGAKVERA